MHWVGFGASVYHLEGGGDASDNLSNFLNLKFKRRKSPIHKDILVLTLSQYSGSLKGILITRADLLWLLLLVIKSFKTAFEKKILCLIYRSIKRMKKFPYLGNLITSYTLLKQLNTKKFPQTSAIDQNVKIRQKCVGRRMERLLPERNIKSSLYCQCFQIKLQRREVPNLFNKGTITFAKLLFIFSEATSVYVQQKEI